MHGWYTRGHNLNIRSREENQCDLVRGLGPGPFSERFSQQCKGAVKVDGAFVGGEPHLGGHLNKDNHRRRSRAERELGVVSHNAKVRIHRLGRDEALHLLRHMLGAHITVLDVDATLNLHATHVTSTREEGVFVHEGDRRARADGGRLVRHGHGHGHVGGG